MISTLVFRKLIKFRKEILHPFENLSPSFFQTNPILQRGSMLLWLLISKFTYRRKCQEAQIKGLTIQEYFMMRQIKRPQYALLFSQLFNPYTLLQLELSSDFISDHWKVFPGAIVPPCAYGKNIYGNEFNAKVQDIWDEAVRLMEKEVTSLSYFYIFKENLKKYFKDPISKIKLSSFNSTEVEVVKNEVLKIKEKLKTIAEIKLFYMKKIAPEMMEDMDSNLSLIEKNDYKENTPYYNRFLYQKRKKLMLQKTEDFHKSNIISNKEKELLNHWMNHFEDVFDLYSQVYAIEEKNLKQEFSSILDKIFKNFQNEDSMKNIRKEDFYWKFDTMFFTK